MGKLPKSGIVSGIILVLAILGFVIWSGSTESNEETTATTTSTTEAVVTTTTVPRVSFMPAQAGGAGISSGNTVSLTLDGGAIVTGLFNDTATFGSTTLTSRGDVDKFVGKISSTGIWEWAHRAGGIWTAVMPDGSEIVIGQFSGTAKFGSTTLTSNGDYDVFVGRISSTGMWVWVAQGGGTGIDSQESVAVTTDGGAIVTGNVTGGNTTFGSIALTGNKFNFIIFVGKISSTGKWVWVSPIRATNFISGSVMAVTADGGAIITGNLWGGTLEFGSTRLTSNGKGDLFVAKISSTGIWEWAVRIGGTGVDTGDVMAAVMPDGNAIVTGGFAGMATFGSTTLTSEGEIDLFVAKISSTGIWEWAVRTGGTGEDFGRDVSVMPDGGAIVTGLFNDTATFGSTTLTSEGEIDLFVAKISSTGIWEWAVRTGGTGEDFGRDVSVMPDGGAIVTGLFNDTATFGSTTLTSEGEIDLFVAKISSTGIWEWAVRAGGTGKDFGGDVSVMPDGNAIVTGGFAGMATFGSTTLTSEGEINVFVAKISSTGVWDS